MLGLLLTAGLATGAVYALIGVSYNLMYNTSRVISFTSGTFGMLGAVFGAFFVGQAGLPVVVALLGALLIGAAAGLLTEFIAVRPVLSRIDTHMYVLSTLALSLIIEEAVGLWWGTEPRPFPRLFEGGNGWVDQKYWLPVVTLAVVVGLLALLNNRTLTGRAFLAISQDPYAARALGLPHTSIRVGVYMLAGVVGALAGFMAGQLTFAFFSIGVAFAFSGFVAIAIGGLGNNLGAVVGGISLGVVEQLANYFLGGSYRGTAALLTLVVALLILPNGIFGHAEPRRV